ncbi:single-stranded DNA-binding protein [Rhodococcus qingshengii]|uniref:single-stranded DNA-binding protein n=2 Tax=Rhodococcus TaxID=1827 RepID=UPI001F34CE5D|nr:single-stranded DNA-binding protein [Rhodococcus qingshengii]
MALPVIRGETARLTRDPEIRFTGGGKAVVNLDLAFNKRIKDRATQEWKDGPTLFVKGTAWEQFAENIAESLSKGDEVIVSGELDTDTYDKRDGTGQGFSVTLAIYAIGPNLKNATAKATRTAKNDGGGQGTYGSGTSNGYSGASSDEPPF